MPPGCAWSVGQRGGPRRRFGKVQGCASSIPWVLTRFFCARGAFAGQTAPLESFTVHGLPAERRTVRVEVAGAELWHLVVDELGLPERLEARLIADGRTLEATFTFFQDEVLVWRRGGEPASEAVALPPGYRLLWPPAAGREICLAGVAPDDGSPAAVMCCLLRRRARGEGGLGLRPVKFTVRKSGSGVTLATPGLPAATAELDAAGRLVRWVAGDEVWVAL